MNWFKDRPVTRLSILYALVGGLWFGFPFTFGIDVGNAYRQTGVGELVHDLSYVFISASILYLILKKEKKAQKLLRQSRDFAENLYASLIRQIQDSVIIYNLDLEKIQLLSDQTRLFFEIAKEEDVSHLGVFLDKVHPEDRGKISELWFDKKEATHKDLVYRIVFPDGRTKWALENRSFFLEENSGNRYSISVLRDITSYMENQQELQAHIKENQVLLTEVHHRVKNNLAIIVSFLQLQSFSVAVETADILNQSVSRVKAIALVHEKIYGSKNLTSIEVKDYVLDLAESLKMMYSKAEIEFDLKIESNPVDITTAIPLGLLLNEFLTNSLRHAFPEARKGNIQILFKEMPGGIQRLEYSDNGIGFAPNFQPEKATSIGLTVIYSLVTQLLGKPLVTPAPFTTGVHFAFQFYPTKEEWRKA